MEFGHVDGDCKVSTAEHGILRIGLRCVCARSESPCSVCHGSRTTTATLRISQPRVRTITLNGSAMHIEYIETRFPDLAQEVRDAIAELKIPSVICVECMEFEQEALSD